MTPGRSVADRIYLNAEVAAECGLGAHAPVLAELMAMCKCAGAATQVDRGDLRTTVTPARVRRPNLPRAT